MNAAGKTTKSRRPRRTPGAHRADQRGITIVELIVVMIMTSMFVGLIAAFTYGYWNTGAKEQADLDTLNTRLTAGDFIRDSVGTSSGLVMQNGLTDPHADDPDPTDVSGTHWVTIHAIPGSAALPAAGTTKPLIYYRRPAQAVNGSYIMNGANPYEDEYVMYLDGTTKSLMLRSIANPSAAGDKLTTSCPPAIANVGCPADKTIAADISSVSMRYFSRTGNTIDWTSMTDPNTGNYSGPDFTAVEVVEFTLNLTVKPFLATDNSVINSTIIRVALRNA